ncbi:MAG: peptidoglycan-binding protein [Deltaproteobacteria bacterium]|nr:peptidoglycan-binding protein [Deltaproteobacteria bacterium]
MPAISPTAQTLIKDARLSAADVVTLKAAVQSGQATVQDVEQLAGRFVDALEAGVGDALRKLLADVGSRAKVGAPIANLAAAPGLLNGTVLLPRDKDTRKDYVPLVQKALIALASRTGDASMMMPKFGADGGWGTETEAALKAFQGAKGLTQSGTVDLATAQALDAALRATRIPPIFAGGVDPNGPSLESMKNAADALVTKRPDAYGVDDAWINCDPRHTLPANTPINGLKGKWKCNLFACNTMAAAGFEPPFYGNRGRGEYPNANQLYKWSDKHAASNGNAGHVRFELRAEIMNADRLSATERELQIKALLAKVEPGDMVIVDHAGPGVADGGHCRVAVTKHGDGSFDFAQASFSQAEKQTESHVDLMGEEHIWVLRPNKRRAEGPAPVA